MKCCGLAQLSAPQRSLRLGVKFILETASYVLHSINAETQRTLNYTEGVRQLQPRVYTLGSAAKLFSFTPKALANTFGVSLNQ